MNIVAIDARDMPHGVAHKYSLMSDTPDRPKWWKVVVMDHVTEKMIDGFVSLISLSAPQLIPALPGVFEEACLTASPP